MANIEIPGYEIVIPNLTWKRPTKPLLTQNDDEVSAVEIMQITRHHSPDENRVLDLIRRASVRIAAGKPRAHGANEHLYAVLSQLPDEVVSAIANGDESHLSHLRKHIPESYSKPGRDYLRVLHGKVPVSLEEQARDEAHEVSRDSLFMYEGLVARVDVGRWFLNLRLDEDSKLPSRSELEYLTSKGVVECDLFAFDGDYGVYDNASSSLMVLHSSLDRSRISAFTDTSKEYLEKKAYESVRGFGRCVEQKMIMGIVSEVIPHILSQLREEPGIRVMKMPRRDNKDPGLN
jgi:hypothetical protein